MGDYGQMWSGWMTAVGCVMAIIGFVAVVVGAVMGVKWLINHIQFI
jgi:hypothetical protein